MTPDNGANLPDPVRSAIKSRHPGIADEIRGAINTLRKLQDLATPSGSNQSAAGATSDSLVPPSAADASLQTAESEVPEAAPGQVPLLAANDSFGRYQVVRLLGRGAMGAVYLAYDAQLQRHVALKTPSLGGSGHAVARFLREARAAAQLRSPYICPVYDVGQIGGIHYLSMAFIDGRPLSKAIAEGQVREPRAIAALIQKIARGLHKAHEQGIIHRDLKPDNIMLDADGEPIVMDFGLARRLDDDVRLTTPGRLLGTPAYMSPEQVDGDPNRIGPPTDIYSLGVVLYEMLTGRLPFTGSLTSILRQISSAEPPKPATLNPVLAECEPLVCVCLRMMARSPVDRYPNMAAVATALDEAFAAQRRAAAAGPSLMNRCVSWAGKLFKSKPRPQPQPAAAAPAPARAPAPAVPEKTLVGSGSVNGGKGHRQQSADVTMDLPQESVAPVPTPAPGLEYTNAEFTLNSQDQSPDSAKKPAASADQTLDLSPSSDDFVINMPDPEQPANKPDASTDQTLDLPMSHGS
jgi:serine/threonine protein kinase